MRRRAACWLVGFAGLAGATGRELDAQETSPRETFARTLDALLAAGDRAAVRELVRRAPARARSHGFELARFSIRHPERADARAAARRLADAVATVLDDARFAAWVQGNATADAERRAALEHFERLCAAASREADLRAALDLARGLEDPYLLPFALHRLADHLRREERLDEARAAYAQGNDGFERVHLHVERAHGLQGAAECLFLLGRLDEAFDAYTRALAVCVAEGETHRIPNLRLNLVRLAAWLARPEPARRELDALEVDPRTSADAEWRLLVLAERAAFEELAGNYGAALRARHARLDLLVERGDSLEVARTRIALAGTYEEVGLASEARALVLAALDALDAEEHPLEHARARLTLGWIAFDAGEREHARAQWHTAAALFDTHDDVPGLAETARLRGILALDAGASDEAVAHFLAAQRGFERCGDAVRATLAELGRARALERRGDLEVCELTTEHALERARSLGHAELRWRAHEVRGRLAERRGALERAIAENTTALELLEGLRARVGARDLERSFLGDRSDLHRRTARLLASRGDVERAAAWVHRFKAQTLWSLLHAGSAAGTVDPALSRARESLTLALRRLDQETDPARRARLGAIVDEARAAVRLAAIRVQLDDASQSPSSEPIPAHAIAAALPVDHAILDYVVGPERVSCLVFRAGRVRWHDLPTTRERLTSWVAALGEPLADLAAGRTDLANLGFDASAAHALHAALLAPLSSELAGVRTTWIVPDGVLRELPFAWLVVERRPLPLSPARHDAHLAGHRYWIEDQVVGYLPMAAWATRPAGGPRPRSLAVIAAPRRPDLPALEGARDEGALAAHHGFRVVRWTGAAASEERFHALDPGFDVLHVAAHAALDANRPSHSRLLLEPSADHDGSLHAFEILGLDLHDALVVLSACRSVGVAGRGEGLAGLSTAFLRAGARGVLATAWDVDDAASRAFADLYYEELVRRSSPVDAAAHAQRRMLRVREWFHPFAWAGYVHVGR